jgi:hypothetical protein
MSSDQTERERVWGKSAKAGKGVALRVALILVAFVAVTVGGGVAWAAMTSHHSPAASASPGAYANGRAYVIKAYPPPQAAVTFTTPHGWCVDIVFAGASPDAENPVSVVPGVSRNLPKAPPAGSSTAVNKAWARGPLTQWVNGCAAG